MKIRKVFGTVLTIASLLFLLFSMPVNAQGYVFAGKWGGLNASGSDGQFRLPNGIALDVTGNVYVADTGNNRIQKFNSGGRFLNNWDNIGRENSKFSSPDDVAVDAAGNVFVADTGNRRTQMLDPRGKFKGVINRSITGSLYDYEIQNPVSVAVKGDYLYVVDSPAGTKPSHFLIFQIPADLPRPFSFVGTFGGLVGETRVSTALYSGIAVDSSGNTYVTDRRNNCIWEYYASAGSHHWGSYGSGDGQFKNPWGVALDSSGNVYVADTGNDRIQKFDSSGRFITKWGSRGTGDGQFFGPFDVAVNSAGTVYVVEKYNNRVQRFRPE